MSAELQLDSDYVGTVQSVVADLSERYTHRFFAEIWKPRTNEYSHTGWQLVDEINRLEPKSVLDVGCGYHPFKGRIQNIVGIDPYNDAADYEVDILDYKVKPESHDVIIALGSINFNSRDEIEERFAHCVNLLKAGGKFFLRANPGLSHKTGPYVDIFPWTFEIVNEFAERYNLKLETFKKEPTELGRLYFVYTKIA
jgi:cyclopropane fatty-acyl-phospholipid synthase-like methyltransferase